MTLFRQMIFLETGLSSALLTIKSGKGFCSEMSQVQIKAVSELLQLKPSNIHLVKDCKGPVEVKSSDKQPPPVSQLRYPCRFCGRKHESKREACPAWGKKCIKGCACGCGKENHFAKKCPISSSSKKVSLVVEEFERDKRGQRLISSSNS